MASEEGFEDPELDVTAAKLKKAFQDFDGDWRRVAIVAHLIRDAREKFIVDSVEHYLEKVIEDTGQENPSVTVKNVRKRLFPEVPQ